MGMERFDLLLTDLLNRFAELVIFTDEEREYLRLAAQAIVERLPDRLPRVLITSGFETDPLVASIEEVIDNVEGFGGMLRDILHGLDSVAEQLTAKVKAES